MIIAVVGPTATGKSDLALDLAQALAPAEVVNADAYQTYRGMDVGTAKVPVAERRGIEHHLLDVVDPAADASVADYQASARAVVEDIRHRGGRAIVVGGSGLYVRALLDHMDFPGTDPAVRAALEERERAEGLHVLFAELEHADPDAARSIGSRNGRRIVRALEVIALTGQPYTANLPRQEYVTPAVQIGLDCDRATLDARVASRVDRMWDEGLVDEVRALRGRLGRTASRAVGYAEVLDLLDGTRTEQEAREAVTANTRRLARKQMGWFGRDPRVHWLDAQSPSLLEDALSIVAAADEGRLVERAAEAPVRRSLGS